MGKVDKSVERLQTFPFTNKNDPSHARITTPVVFQLAKDHQKTVTLVPVHESGQLPLNLVKVLHEEFNYVVEEGQTYPHHETKSLDDFVEYWFTFFVAVLIEGDYSELDQLGKLDFSVEEWREKFLGNFYIKPNYIGRCSHVCNAGFLVNRNKRGLGLGTEMGKKYLDWAAKLGFVYSVFNLVFETNVASVKIWDSLGFDRIGYVKNVAVLKGHNSLVGAIMYGKDIV